MHGIWRLWVRPSRWAFFFHKCIGSRWTSDDISYEKDVQAMKKICQGRQIGNTCSGTSHEVVWSQWINVGTRRHWKLWRWRIANEDLLQGLCEELELFPGPNALEILDITIIVYAVDHLISVRDEWGRLDTVISWVFTAAWDFDRRYPPLSRAKACGELEGVSRKQFPRLWENTDVKLNFLMRYFKPGVNIKVGWQKAWSKRGLQIFETLTKSFILC